MKYSFQQDTFDVIVVGGGINGVGIARDCALRGISCLLIEKNDYSAGTSGASSGMIHGGPRYMLDDVEVTRLSCLDSGYIQKVAPHLLFRIPFLYPVYQKPDESSIKAKALLEAVEAFFTAYDRFVPLKNGKPHTRLSREQALALEPNLTAEGLLGAVTFDEWGIDVPRLCVANVLDAVGQGAVALNHTEVIHVDMAEGRFTGVEILDRLTKQKQKIRGKILVNATGPWSETFAKKFGLTVKLRPSKGIHLVYDRRLFNMAIATQAIDGREMFVMPYENTTIIATTDDDYFGNLDEQQSTEDEIKYLQEAIVKVFPQIRHSRLIYTYSGVRPTLYARDKNESALSREHEIVDHELTDAISGVYSLIGGKLASYRIMAEELVDIIAKKLGNTKPCTTHSRFLPGGAIVPDVATLAKDYPMLDPYAIARLVYRHGDGALPILQDIAKNPKEACFVCVCEPVTTAEFRHVLKNEQAKTLSDIRRRTRWTQGPCQGTQCLISGLGLCAQTQASQDVLQDVQSFQNEWWHNRACVLEGTQLKQEEIFQALHFCNNSLFGK